MYIITAFVFTISFVGCVTGRAISSLDAGLEGNQYSKHGLLEATGQFFSQAQDETGSLTRTEFNENLMRSLKSILLDAGLQSKVQDSSPPNKDRPKRSFYPYIPSYQMPWPQLQVTNPWSTNVYPIQSPHLISISGFDGSVSNYNLKYSYFENTEPQPINTERKRSLTTVPLELSVKSMYTAAPRKARFQERPEKKIHSDKPVWDVSDYRPTYAKPPRFSRAWKRELHRGAPPSPSTFMQNNDEAHRAVYLTNTMLEDNEIPSFQFDKATSSIPSRCTWAILSCCSTSTEDVNHKCFQEMGCEGPFWGVQVCSAEYMRVAMEAASDFYKIKFDS